MTPHAAPYRPQTVWVDTGFNRYGTAHESAMRLLAQHSHVTVNEFSAITKINNKAARKVLQALVKTGMVEVSTDRIRCGRPRKMFSATKEIAT